MLTFNKKYFLLTILLFLLEVVIALYVRDSIIRPHGGDYLVVIFLYCALRTFWKAPVLKVALGVLLFSYVIEVLQYFQLIRLLGLQDNTLAGLVLGYKFEWLDMLAYTLGILTVIGLESISSKQTPARKLVV